MVGFHVVHIHESKEAEGVILIVNSVNQRRDLSLKNFGIYYFFFQTKRDIIKAI